MQDNPNIRFVIVGEAGQLEELDELRVELGVTNLTLLPFVPDAEYPEMLAAADISLIMQKQNMVGFNMPSKTQKITASGRPIVASVPEGGSAAEAVLQSGCGLVVEPESPTALTQAIQTLYDNPEQLELLGRKGRQFAVDYYSFEQALNAYESLLASVVKSESKDKAPASKSLPTTAMEPRPSQAVVALAQDLRPSELGKVR